MGFLVRVSQAGDQTLKSPGCFLSGRNALVCSHDHLTLFLTLVSGLEFIRFDLDLVRCLWGTGGSTELHFLVWSLPGVAKPGYTCVFR